jgi:ABC-type multidrug transport system fused ATPase/permease subunit
VLSFTLAFAINKVADQLDDVQAIGLIGIGSIIRALFIFGILFVVAYKVDRELALIGSGVFAAAFTADLLGRTMIHALRAKERKAALNR